MRRFCSQTKHLKRSLGMVFLDYLFSEPAMSLWSYLAKECVCVYPANDCHGDYPTACK